MPITEFPTLTAIAKEAGVSRMTVSRVLRQSRYIAPQTRTRVLNVAEKLNYRPNPMVSAMMTYVRSGSVHASVGVLAYITSGPSRRAWRSSATPLRFFLGASDRAKKRGYQLEEFYLNERGMTMGRLSEILYARGIAGVIVGPMFLPRSHLSFDWQKFSVVAIGYSLLKPFVDRVTNDQYNSMLLALRQMRRYGYQRIGLAVESKDDERVHYHWSAAYLSHHHRFNKEKHIPLYLPRAWRWQDFFKWVRRHQPDAIITTSNSMYERMLQEGYRLPDDIGLVHVDVSASKGPVAGIEQNPEGVGGAAVDLVTEQIERNIRGIPVDPRTLTLLGRWVDGPTIRIR